MRRSLGLLASLALLLAVEAFSPSAPQLLRRSAAFAPVGSKALRRSVASLRMSGDWVQAQDPESGRTYWYNQKSGESSWDAPAAASGGGGGGAEGLRGPFGPEDTFTLQDGREYQPIDAATDSLYGSAINNPIDRGMDDETKAKIAIASLGFAVLVPFLLVVIF